MMRDAMVATNEQIFTLHRYLLWANRSRYDFHSRSRGAGVPPDEPRAFLEWFRPVLVDMAPWMGSLYVVIEGWKELGLTHSRVDELLLSSHVDNLRRFRNGVFHFQPTYFDDRFIQIFVGAGADWALELHDEFSEFFKDRFESQGIEIAVEELEDGGI
jgi:hypothetical protein